MFIYESFTAFVVGEINNMKKFPQTELDPFNIPSVFPFSKTDVPLFILLHYWRVCIYFNPWSGVTLLSMIKKKLLIISQELYMNVTETLLIYASCPKQSIRYVMLLFKHPFFFFYQKNNKQNKLWPSPQYILFHSSTRHLSNFIFKNDIEILGAAVIFLTHC